MNNEMFYFSLELEDFPSLKLEKYGRPRSFIIMKISNAGLKPHWVRNILKRFIIAIIGY
jgi:hypothetical protein